MSRETIAPLIISILSTLDGAGHPLTPEQIERAIPGHTLNSEALGIAWQESTRLRLIRFSGSAGERSTKPTFGLTERGEVALQNWRRTHGP